MSQDRSPVSTSDQLFVICAGHDMPILSVSSVSCKPSHLSEKWYNPKVLQSMLQYISVNVPKWWKMSILSKSFMIEINRQLSSKKQLMMLIWHWLLFKLRCKQISSIKWKISFWVLFWVFHCRHKTSTWWLQEANSPTKEWQGQDSLTFANKTTFWGT